MRELWRHTVYAHQWSVHGTSLRNLNDSSNVKSSLDTPFFEPASVNLPFCHPRLHRSRHRLCRFSLSCFVALATIVCSCSGHFCSSARQTRASLAATRLNSWLFPPYIFPYKIAFVDWILRVKSYSIRRCWDVTLQKPQLARAASLYPYPCIYIENHHQFSYPMDCG